MDRREWLTLIYREANLFIRNNQKLVADVTSENRDIDEIKSELNKQLLSILSNADSLEDFVKFSVLRDPGPELWQNEPTWERALISVALECLSYDVMGIVVKIVDGELMSADPMMIHDFEPIHKIPMRDDTVSKIKQGMPGTEDDVDQEDGPDGDGEDEKDE